MNLSSAVFSPGFLSGWYFTASLRYAFLSYSALDPFGKIAELKYCAVKVTKGGKLAGLASYGGGQSFATVA